MEKLCKKCREVKEVGEFYKHKGMKGGYLSQCKECKRKQDGEYRKNHVLEIKEKNRVYRLKNLEAKRRSDREYCKTHKTEKSEYDKYYRLKNEDRINEYQREYRLRTKGYKQKGRKRCAKHRRKYPERMKANYEVRKAIRNGILTREPCALCKSEERIHAHHDDYSKPFDVDWLCHCCHRLWHRLKRQWERQRESGRWEKQYLSIVEGNYVLVR